MWEICCLTANLKPLQCLRLDCSVQFISSSMKKVIFNRKIGINENHHKISGPFLHIVWSHAGKSILQISDKTTSFQTIFHLKNIKSQLNNQWKFQTKEDIFSKYIFSFFPLAKIVHFLQSSITTEHFIGILNHAEKRMNRRKCMKNNECWLHVMCYTRDDLSLCFECVVRSYMFVYDFYLCRVQVCGVSMRYVLTVLCRLFVGTPL